jgi:hypothetical protein
MSDDRLDVVLSKLDSMERRFESFVPKWLECINQCSKGPAVEWPH